MVVELELNKVVPYFKNMFVVRNVAYKNTKRAKDSELDLPSNFFQFKINMYRNSHTPAHTYTCTCNIQVQNLGVKMSEHFPYFSVRSSSNHLAYNALATLIPNSDHTSRFLQNVF